ncbi:MAG: sigma factor-like helix-turn-helix DNA-binding protein, partial [Patescibacteria group bacterium]
MSIINFKPKQATKKLISALSYRSKEVMESRYGLGKNSERLTLEAIGQQYGITRERVRQIENHSIVAIRKSKYYTEEKAVFDELEQLIHSLGGVIVEHDILDHISKDETIQNHINFLLVVGHPFKKIKEDDDFRHRWYVDDELSNKVHASLKRVYENLKDEDLIPETEMIKAFMDQVKDLAENLKNEEMIRRWLSISKRIGKN